MKQVALCDEHKGLWRISDMYAIEVNELTINPKTGRRVFTKTDGMICKPCANKIGYQPKKRKAKNAESKTQ